MSIIIILTEWIFAIISFWRNTLAIITFWRNIFAIISFWQNFFAIISFWQNTFAIIIFWQNTFAIIIFWQNTFATVKFDRILTQIKLFINTCVLASDFSLTRIRLKGWNVPQYPCNVLPTRWVFGDVCVDHVFQLQKIYTWCSWYGVQRY